MLELRKREEEERRRQEAEARKKKAEEENKKRLEELMRKAEEDRAVKAVMPVIQKVRFATPESFPTLKEELETVLSKEQARAGNQFKKLRDDADKAVDAAGKCIEMILARRRLVEEKKAAEEAKRKEMDEQAKALVEELRDLVNSAEEQSKKLESAAAPLASLDNPGGVASLANKETCDGIQEAIKQVEVAGTEAENMTRACTTFVLQKGPEMKRLVPMSLGADPSDISQTLAKLLQHIRDLAVMSEKTLSKAKQAREKLAKRFAADERTKKMQAAFRNYDEDGDGLLSREEVLAFCKGEFNFCPPESVINKLWKNDVEEGAPGLAPNKFHCLRMTIGIAREVARDQVRAVVRVEKEQVLEAVKSVIVEKLKGVACAVSDADQEVAKVEKQVAPLLAKARIMPVPDMVTLAEETDAMIKDAKCAVVGVWKQMDAVSDGLNDRFKQDIQAQVAIEAKLLHMNMGRMEARLTRALNLTRRFRDAATRKRDAELNGFRRSVAKVLRHNQGLRNLTDATVFGDSITLQDFVVFWQAAEKNVPIAQEKKDTGLIKEASVETDRGICALGAPAKEAVPAGSVADAAEPLMEKAAGIEPQLGASLTEEAEKWLASELAAVEGRMEQSEQAAQEAVPEVVPQSDAGSTAVEEVAPAAVPAPMETPEETPEECAKPAEPSPASAPAPPPPPPPPEEPKVETIELSQSDIERLFAFLDEDGSGTLARDVLLNRLTRA